MSTTVILLIAEVQVKPDTQEAGVQCDLLRPSGPSVLTAEASVQCEVMYLDPCFTSTPRRDSICISTSESEMSDAPNTSTGMYIPSTSDTS